MIAPLASRQSQSVEGQACTDGTFDGTCRADGRCGLEIPPNEVSFQFVAGQCEQGGNGNNNNNAGVEACRAANALANHCASAIPGIKDAPTEEIGKCFCCDGADFDPDFFDGIAASCADYLSEERPDATDEYKGMSKSQSSPVH